MAPVTYVAPFASTQPPTIVWLPNVYTTQGTPDPTGGFSEYSVPSGCRVCGAALQVLDQGSATHEGYLLSCCPHTYSWTGLKAQCQPLAQGSPVPMGRGYVTNAAKMFPDPPTPHCTGDDDDPHTPRVIKPKPMQNGATCGSCKEYYPYAEVPMGETLTCYSCRSTK
jgi:hypothetical protein